MPDARTATDAALRVERDGTDLRIRLGEVEIAVYRSGAGADPGEAPKPHLHPLRFGDGAPASVGRPWDHRWHSGLQMTWSEVSGQNFWGGPTFAPDEGYRWIDNVGRIHRTSLAAGADDEGGVDIAEELRWITAADEHWLDEQRHQRIEADPARGLWTIDLHTVLLNRRDADLELGSPTTLGRPAAGYTGWFWRGPRSFTGAEVIGPDGPASDEALMGAELPWIALVGRHDERDGGGTVLAFAGESSATTPIRWFVRSQPFAALAPSPSFDEVVHLAPEDDLSLSHRYVFVDRPLAHEELVELAAELRP
jgi:hypothetical protein